jgi:hypothetical protein
MTDPSTELTTIYVYLLDEGVDCWRPIDAVKRGDNLYEIVSKNPDPEDEKWEFSTGDVVRCVLKTLMDRQPHESLVAIEKVERAV